MIYSIIENDKIDVEFMDKLDMNYGSISIITVDHIANVYKAKFILYNKYYD